MPRDVNADDAPLTDARDWPSHRGDFASAIKWLLIGTLLYGLFVMIAVRAEPQASTALAPVVSPGQWLTPLFGLPYAIVSLRWRGRTRRLLFFGLLVPAAHVAAHYLAYWYIGETWRPTPDGHDFEHALVAGGLAGVAGATLSFTALALLGLAPRDRVTLRKAALATPVLGGIGAATMAYGLAWTQALRSLDAGDIILWLEGVYLPWQAAFALFLAWTLRIPPRRRWRLVRIEPSSPRGAGQPAVAVGR